MVYTHKYTRPLINKACMHYLIPWPGPHWILEMEILELPSPIEIQSSPVPILQSVTFTFWHPLIWRPSVFGLSPGAVMVRFWTVKPELSCNFTWKPLLFTKLMFSIVELFAFMNIIDYTNKKKKHIRLDFQVLYIFSA